MDGWIRWINAILNNSTYPALVTKERQMMSMLAHTRVCKYKISYALLQSAPELLAALDPKMGLTFHFI